MADRSLCFCEQRAGLGPIREGQEASHAAGILDVQAEQGWVAEQDRAGFWIEPKLHPLDLGAQFAGEILRQAPRRLATPRCVRRSDKSSRP